jgi:glucan biosynthesis protein
VSCDDTHPGGNEATLQSIRGFRVFYVFDISRTEDEEIPDLDAAYPGLLDDDAAYGLSARARRRCVAPE